MNSVAIGRVRTSFGLDGSVKIQSYSGETDHFFGVREVELRGPSVSLSVTIERIQLVGDVPVIKFSGIDTPERAKELSGFNLWVDRSHAAARGPGEYYVTDLIGLEVVRAGSRVGTVRAVIDGPQGDLLEVERTSGSVLVPFLDRFLGEVNEEDRTIEVLEDWILE